MQILELVLYGYNQKVRHLPFKLGQVNIITGRLKINPENSDIPVFATRDEVEIIRDSEIRVNKDEIKALKGLEDK